ncbi:DinB superfamily protein [Stieleria neptunia]|uniref:DinB superfamily protein n=1 Tax=Stieleria neptunia TaxID=2527979 RepID=A0A518HL77_9BACT|nr:DinB family protein [Stieleria neptunia]QDV41604.1 DinB superfamily protein [Stieleria neptunia]
MTRIFPCTRVLCGAAFVVAVLMLSVPSSVIAADGEPLAIRLWPDGRVGIENHWGLRIMISTSGSPQQTTASPFQKVLTNRGGVDHVWSRQANADAASWGPATEPNAIPGSIRVTSMPGRDNEAVGMLVRTDGVRVAILGDSSGAGDSLTDVNAKLDVVVLPSPAGALLADAATAAWIKAMQPRYVLLPAAITDEAAKPFADSIDASGEMIDVDHNTFAISQSTDRDQPTRLVKLNHKPYELSEELESLMTKMEASCSRSQAVFSPLSANQLNFRPANGTHTPRWNAEHMMGRQLLFFSQIYHALDPAIPVMDLNPEQMPPDYTAAQPDWDGQEEARQMQRVSDFTRRFAYLLRGINLDVRAPGSRWTLRGLLRQMDRHYDDHTANTKKKFELAGWPDD